MNMPGLTRSARALTAVALLGVVAAAAGAWIDGAGLEHARQRFASLTSGERATLRERYETFKSLPDAEQDALRRRARNLARLDEEVMQSLPQDVSEQLASLPPLKQREIRRDMLISEARERGRRVREKLPPEELARLRRAPSASERAGFLQEFKHRNVDRFVSATLERLGPRVGIDEARLAALRALPREERVRELIAWTSELSEEDVVRWGLPFRISREQWAQWRDLSPEAFFTELMRHREALIAERERTRWRELRQVGTSPRSALDPEYIAGLRELLGAARARQHRDQVEFAHLSQPERRIRLSQLKRDRCMAVITDRSLLSLGELEELRYLPEGEFFATVRRLVEPLFDEQSGQDD